MISTLALVVNYRSADLTLQAVHSILDSESSGPVKIVVFDNSEDIEEEKKLRNNLPKCTELVVNPKNLGFGPACNLGVKKFESDCILLLNPDAKLLPGALIRMQRTLYESQSAAAVGPQIFWDDKKKFYLPPSYLPFFLFFHPLLSGLGSRSIVGKIAKLTWRKYSIAIWRSKTPVRVFNLSGGHCLLKTKPVQNAGGLFDERFFLYFEDTDLFMRLRKKGYSLLVDPGAEAVHYYDQCGKNEWTHKRKSMNDSYALFLNKYMRNKHSILKRYISFRKPVQKEEMGARDFLSPFSIKIPPQIRQGWLFEWSPNPDLMPAVGSFGKGPVFFFPRESWERLAPGRYFGRIGSSESFFESAKIRLSWNIQ